MLDLALSLGTSVFTLSHEFSLMAGSYKVLSLVHAHSAAVPIVHAAT